MAARHRKTSRARNWFTRLPRKRRLFVYVTAFLVVIEVLAACTGQPSPAQKSAIDANDRLQSQVYNPRFNIEFNNYNDRQKIADDPTTILWCTAYSSNPNVKPITVPIVGKLTSSKKRPYSTQQVSTNDYYSPEVPGPDHMFGDSTEYRYGFTPGGVYVDFTSMSTVCTTQPMVWQSATTTVVVKVDPQLNAATKQARAALQSGVDVKGVVSKKASNEAQNIIENANGGK